MKHFFLVLAMLMMPSFLLVSCNAKMAKKGEVWKNSIGMEFVKISSGSFMMGSPTTEEFRGFDEVQHEVKISKDFYIGKYEVTQAQWKATMGSLPSKCDDYVSFSGEFVGDNKPITCVSWDDAQEFIKQLNAKGEGTYRLPTEAEWEYAARGGNSGKWSFGDVETELGKYAWCLHNAESKTQEVGTKQPNNFGLYDMHGNVSEWCQDWHGDYPSGSVTDPTGVTVGQFRVNRGGSWGHTNILQRSAIRYDDVPSRRNNNLGFRVVTTGDNSTNSPTNTADSNSTNSPTNTADNGMEVVKIPSGSFMMGSNDGGSDEKPVHKVTISNSFYIGKYEVTQAQWKAIMGSNPSNFKGDNLPVEKVSWKDAQEFIKKLNAKGEGTYRLPTEAEWEYAARAGTTGDYYGNLDSIAWYDGNSGKKTHPVGQKQANAFGLYDMNGNVWEWCQDWYGAYPSGSVTDPTGATSGSYRLNRGGSWYDAYNFGSAVRAINAPSIRDDGLGFRVVRQ